MNKSIPEFIYTVLKLMEDNEFAPYLVGGCVRDMIMNRTPRDFDVTVDALPEEINDIFISHGFQTWTKGREFGTVVVRSGDDETEITPHRTESNYKDARHPSKVEFVKDLKLDLSRRDFTINAIAMDLYGNIVDPFGGCDDIRSGILRCVGDPFVRFGEDALRILRAMRFASRFGFTIEENTKSAMNSHRNLLLNISSERVRAELSEALSYPYSFDILTDCSDIIHRIIPCFIPHRALLSKHGDFISKLFSCICHENFDTVCDVCDSLKLKNDDADKMRSMHLLYNNILTRNGENVIFDDKTKTALCDHKTDHVYSVYEFSDSLCDEFEFFINNGIYRLGNLAVSGGDIVSSGLFPKNQTSGIIKKILYKVACEEIENKRESIFEYLSYIRDDKTE